MSQSQSSKVSIDISSCNNSFNDVTWNVIQKLFTDNPQLLVQHHIDSYNSFVDKGIKEIIQNSPFNEFTVQSSDKDKAEGSMKMEIKVILGKRVKKTEKEGASDVDAVGTDGNDDVDSIIIKRPTILTKDAVSMPENSNNDDNNNDSINLRRNLYPNEARLLNKTYEMDIDLNITLDIKVTRKKDKGKKEEEEVVATKVEMPVPLCSLPIMVQSNKCFLSGMTKLQKYNLGECRNDKGGYFIINGKEKTIVSQQEFGNNLLRVYKDNTKSIYSYLADIRTVGEESAMLPRRLSVRMVAPDSHFTNNNIVVDVPNLHQPIPLFILFRALGVVSDKDIIEMCLLDMETNSNMIELFRPSIQDTTKLCDLHRERVGQAKCTKCKEIRNNSAPASGYEYVLTQCDAMEYLKAFVKNNDQVNVIDCLNNYFLPNIGSSNHIEKAMFLGYIVYNLLSVYTGSQNVTDRDSYRFRRIKTSGSLLYGLFTEYFKVFATTLNTKLDKFVNDLNLNTLLREVEENKKSGPNKKKKEKSKEVKIQEHILQKKVKGKLFPKFNAMNTGIRKAFKGRWGATIYTRAKKKGVVQDVKRLSFNSFMAHLRKVVTPLDDSTKIVKPHRLQNSQYGILDPVDTPDGSNIGLHNYLSIGAHITESFTPENNRLFVEKILKGVFSMIPLKDLRPDIVKNNTKVFLNGTWIGIFLNGNGEDDRHPKEILDKLREMRLTGCFSTYVSISWNVHLNQFIIFTDAGRLTRPVFTVSNSIAGYQIGNNNIDGKIKSNNFTWNELIYGFSNNSSSLPIPSQDGEVVDTRLKSLEARDTVTVPGPITYLDTSEEETVLVANYSEQLDKKNKSYSKYYTHLEIHPSLIFGYMGNQIVFPENNQGPRNIFSCSQSQQAVSLYNSNYFSRMDKMGVVLNYGQVPLIKSRYMRLMNNEEHPYGENAIVAIMVYGGYNVEDSILFNEGAIKRGLFRTTYYSMYESTEQTQTVTPAHQSEENEDEENKEQDPRDDDALAVDNYTEREDADDGYDRGEGDGNDDNEEDGEDDEYASTNYTMTLDNRSNVTFTSGGNSLLGKHGVIEVDTKVDDKMPLIGKESWVEGEEDKKHISFVKPKKGQLGYVDRTYISNTSIGSRVAKVSIREERVPAIGDKFCSRCGQKGTIGQIIPEEDMPFTSDGIKPDLIINPHALPSRMTIGQMIESVMGKACLQVGGYGDCTAFINKDKSPNDDFGSILPRYGYHSKGSEILYNGMSGKQLRADIFIGPTYYMRLKHMVKDKINYRAKGGTTNLTRQTTKGRANDGGLRIGEMERDGIIGYGASSFLQESMLNRGDDHYYMAICNNSGAIAIYNNKENIYISPQSDGPIQFNYSPSENSKFVDGSNYFGVSLDRIRKGHVYGKSFSIIRIPYAFKLLMQELQTMNIHMKIITEDNIDQLTNVSFSNRKLDFSPEEMEKIRKIRNVASTKKQKVQKGGRKGEDKDYDDDDIREGTLEEEEEDYKTDELEEEEEAEEENEKGEEEEEEEEESSKEEEPEDFYEEETDNVGVKRDDEGEPTTIEVSAAMPGTQDQSIPFYDTGVVQTCTSTSGLEDGQGATATYVTGLNGLGPRVINVDSDVILLKSGSNPQSSYASSLAEKEKELQLNIDLLEAKQRLAAIERNSNKVNSIIQMEDRLSEQLHRNKRADGIELLIDTQDEDKDDMVSYGRRRSKGDGDSQEDMYEERKNVSGSNNDGNTKQIKL